MNQPTCAFEKEIVNPGGERITLCCDRKPYKNGMCVLHLDKHVAVEDSEDEQRQITNDFVETLKKEIEFAQSAAPDDKLNWNGVNFPAIKFDDKWIFPRRVLLTAARFEYGTSFNGCRFSGGLNANKSIFLGPKKNFIFNRCHFVGKVNFRSVDFGVNPVLRYCIFEKEVGFDSCNLDTPDFHDNEFHDGVVFAKNTFSGICDFKSCEFKNETDFLSILVSQTAVFDFRRSIFSGSLNFGAGDDQLDNNREQEVLAFTELDFSDVTVLEKTALIFQYIASYKTSFYGLQLSDGATLKFKHVDFGEGDFSNIPPQEKVIVSFQNTRLDNTTFLNTNIEKFYFNNITWCPVELLLGLTGNRQYLASKINSREEISKHIRNLKSEKESKYLQSRFRQGLVSEVILQTEIYKQIHIRDPQSGKESELSKDIQDQLLKDVDRNSENYRQLVKNSDAKRDYTLAENFHIGEMEMQRQKGTVNGAKYLGLRRKLSSWNGFSIYKFISKYGTSTQSFLICRVFVLI